MNKSSDLTFHPAYQPEGFNSNAMDADDQTNPAIVVRELIQNSVDASLEAGRAMCLVDYVLEDASLREIPVIESYRSALANAKIAHKENIEATSDLRYIIYVGVTKNGSTCISGQVFLTSHPPPSDYSINGGSQKVKLLSKDGYNIEDVSEDNDLKSIFKFPQYRHVLKFAAGKLGHICRKFGFGSVVSILGFNDFRWDGDASSVNRIFEETVCNFFIPILPGKFAVTVRKNGAIHRLTNPVLEKIFQGNRENRRKTKQSLLRSLWMLGLLCSRMDTR